VSKLTTLSSFCTVFDVYYYISPCSFNREAQILLFKHEKLLWVWGGARAPVPHGSAPARGQRYVTSMFYWATSTASFISSNAWSGKGWVHSGLTISLQTMSLVNSHETDKDNGVWTFGPLPSRALSSRLIGITLPYS